LFRRGTVRQAPDAHLFNGDVVEVALYSGLVPPERIAAHRAAAG
jgi:hypothetical protein